MFLSSAVGNNQLDASSFEQCRNACHKSAYIVWQDVAVQRFDGNQTLIDTLLCKLIQRYDLSLDLIASYYSGFVAKA